MDSPRLKRDWIGRRVRLRRAAESGMQFIPAGTILTVRDNRAGLTLATDAGPSCGVRVFIRRIPEYWVDLLPLEEARRG